MWKWGTGLGGLWLAVVARGAFILAKAEFGCKSVMGLLMSLGPSKEVV